MEVDYELLRMILLLIAVFNLIEIFTDLTIVTVIPQRMIMRRLENPKVVESISQKYGKGVLKAIKPEIMKMGNEFITKISQSTENKITNIVNNDIPHIIDERMEGIETKISNQITVQLEDLKLALNRNLGSQGGIAKGVKQQERLLKEQLIRDSDPKAYEQVTMARMMKKFTGMTNTEMDQLLDLKLYQLQKDGKLDQKSIGTMPVLQGPLPLQSASPEAVRSALEKSPAAAKDGAQSTGVLAGQEATLRATMTNSGVPKEMQDLWINEGKDNLKKKELKTDGKQKGKEKRKS